MNKRILVTSYPNPDLDGTACAFAYAEFLNQKNREAVVGVFGNPHREAQFVLDRYKIKINKIETINEEYEGIIFLDASDLEALPKVIMPEQIIEIIDHRKVNNVQDFPNAKAQIELVGSCATLITEKFQQNNILPSRESAVLLYLAIVSNTINFQGKLTTTRDANSAEWLKKQINLPADFIHEMFVFKSIFTKPLAEIIADDFKAFQIDDKKISIAQLEIVDANNYVKNNFSELKNVLSEIRQSNPIDCIFLNCIDLEGKGNTFLAPSEEDIKFLEPILKVKFENNLAAIDYILMRKEITSLIKDSLDKNK